MDGRPAKVPRVLEIIWCPPPTGWLKVNTNGAVFEGLTLASYVIVLRTCRGFANSCFAIPLSVCFTFETELAAAIHTIEYA